MTKPRTSLLENICIRCLGGFPGLTETTKSILGTVFDKNICFLVIEDFVCIGYLYVDDSSSNIDDMGIIILADLSVRCRQQNHGGLWRLSQYFLRLDGGITYNFGCGVNNWQHTGYINCMYPAHSSLLMSQLKLGTKPLSNFFEYAPPPGFEVLLL